MALRRRPLSSVRYFSRRCCLASTSLYTVSFSTYRLTACGRRQGRTRARCLVAPTARRRVRAARGGAARAAGRRALASSWRQQRNAILALFTILREGGAAALVAAGSLARAKVGATRCGDSAAAAALIRQEEGVREERRPGPQAGVADNEHKVRGQGEVDHLRGAAARREAEAWAREEA